MAGHVPPLLLLANKRRMSTRVSPQRYSVGFFRGRLSERIATGRVARDVQRRKNPRYAGFAAQCVGPLGADLFSAKHGLSVQSRSLICRPGTLRRRRCFLMLLLPIRLAEGLNGLQFLLFQRAVEGGEVSHELVLDLLDDVLQFAAQYFRALNLRSGRTPVVAIHVAINRGQEFTQPFFAGDGAAFFGGNNLRTDLVRRSGKLGETLAQGIVGRQRASLLGGGV